jgi:hypothetical protein
LPNRSKERDQAETRFKKAQKATQDAKEARADYESEARTVREKTARLKALRLAKEAADLKTRVDKKPIASKKRPQFNWWTGKVHRDTAAAHGTEGSELGHCPVDGHHQTNRAMPEPITIRETSVQRP